MDNPILEKQGLTFEKMDFTGTTQIGQSTTDTKYINVFLIYRILLFYSKSLKQRFSLLYNLLQGKLTPLLTGEPS